MIPGALTVSGFFWLAVFIGIAALTNKILGRRAVNGAIVFCWIAGLIALAVVVMAFFAPSLTEHAATWIGGLAIPFIVALYLSHKFKAGPKSAA